MTEAGGLCEVVKSHSPRRALDCVIKVPADGGRKDCGVRCVSLLPWLEALCPEGQLLHCCVSVSSSVEQR